MVLARHLRLMSADLKVAFSDFSWTSRKTRMALKTALACVSAILITYALDFSDGFWAGISAIIMMKPNVGATFQKAWMRAGGACVGCTLSIVVSSLFVQDPLGFSISIFLIITAGFYFGTTRPSGYFWSYMFGHMAIVSMVSVMDPDCTIYVIVTRAAAVSIGVIVSCIIHTTIWPEYAHETLQEKVRDLESDVFRFIRHIMEQYLSCTYDPETTEAEYQRLGRRATRHGQLVEEARYERVLFRGHLALQNKRIEASAGHIHRFMEFYRSAMAEADSRYVARYADSISILLSRLSEWMKARGGPDGVRKQLETQISEIFLQIRQSQVELGKNEAERPPILPIMLFYEGMHFLSRFFKDMSDAAGAADPADINKAPSVQIDKGPNAAGFFARHFPVHIPVLQYAVKGGLGILMVFWFWLWAEIPGGGLNMSVAVITVLQIDLMTTYQRGMLRFLGCFLGAALGLLLLGLQVDNTFVMGLIVFWAIFPLAYIWAGGPNAAYLGAQAGIALIITLFPDKGPATTLAPVIERLVGIFLAVLSVWTLNLLLWPQDLTERLESLLGAAKERMLHLSDLVDRFYRGQSTEKPSGIDTVNMRLIGSMTETLEEQSEISPEEAFLVREWVTALNELFNETADLMAIGVAPLLILHQLRPDFEMRLSKAIKASATGVSITDVRRNMAEIDDLMEASRGMAEQLREVTRERDTRFKLICSLHILSVRRVLFGLRGLWELQAKRISVRESLCEADDMGLECLIEVNP